MKIPKLPKMAMYIKMYCQDCGREAEITTHIEVALPNGKWKSFHVLNIPRAGERIQYYDGEIVEYLITKVIHNFLGSNNNGPAHIILAAETLEGTQK